MTDREKAIVMAHTGICMLAGEKFGVFHAYIEDIMRRPVYTHELAIQSISDEIKEKSRNDFIKLCKEAQQPCSDAISRQAVLDLIKHYNSDGLGSVFYGYEEGVKFADKVKKLPPITSQEPCEDAIRREDALQALCKAVHKNDDTIPCSNQRESCLWSKTKVQDYAREIWKLPSVTPQPKTGHWISHYDEDAKEGWYECDRCHTERAFNTKFCPDCGAKMIEPQESAYDRCPICVNRNKNCQFGSSDCRFEEQIDMAESKDKG